MSRIAAAALMLVAIAASPSPAAAQDPKQACFDAHERSQSLRQSGSLRAARDALLVCADPSCPAALQRDCNGWLGEVQAALPTIVVDARDPAGGDLTDVRVTVDGQVLAEGLDGKAIAIDPGPHAFRFERAGAPAVEQNLVIREGEKSRRVIVTIASAPPRVELHRPIPALVWVLGAVGLAGAGVGLGFFLAARSGETELEDRGCAPLCPEDEAEAVDQKDTIALAGASVATAALAGALVLFVTRPTVELRAGDASAVVAIGPRGLALAGCF